MSSILGLPLAAPVFKPDKIDEDTLPFVVSKFPKESMELIARFLGDDSLRAFKCSCKGINAFFLEESSQLQKIVGFIMQSCVDREVSSLTSKLFFSCKRNAKRKLRAIFEQSKMHAQITKDVTEAVLELGSLYTGYPSLFDPFFEDDEEIPPEDLSAQIKSLNRTVLNLNMDLLSLETNTSYSKELVKDPELVKKLAKLLKPAFKPLTAFQEEEESSEEAGSGG